MFTPNINLVQPEENIPVRIYTTGEQYSSITTSIPLSHRRVYSINHLIQLQRHAHLNRSARRMLFVMKIWQPSSCLRHTFIRIGQCTTPSHQHFSSQYNMNSSTKQIEVCSTRVCLTFIHVISRAYAILNACVAVISSTLKILNAAVKAIQHAYPTTPYPQYDKVRTLANELSRSQNYRNKKTHKKAPERTRAIKIATVNVNGLIGKIDSLKLALCTYDIDICCIQETKMCSAHSNAIVDIDGYCTFRKDRNIHGGGVCIYAKSKLKPSVISCNSNSEIVGIKVKDLNFTAFSIYKPPNVNADNFYEELVDVTTLFSDNTTLIIAGDTNMNLMSKSKKRKVDEYCLEMNVKNHVDKATHKDACIDHIMVTKGIHVQNIRLLSPIEKWHAFVTCEVIVEETRVQSLEEKSGYLKWNKTNWDDMLSWIRNQELLSKMQSEQSLEECWAIFKNVCLTATALFVPQGKFIERKKNKSWISSEAAKLLKRKDRAYKLWRRSYMLSDRSKYEKLRKTCKKRLMKDKLEWLNNSFNIHCPIKFWRQVAKLRNGTERPGIPELLVNDIKATSDQEKANLLQKQFESVWTQKKSPLLIESGPNESIDCPAKATLHALQNLDVKKAPGPDGISPRILRKMSIAIAPALSHIISLSWRNSEIPSDWKKAVVVPIPKKARSSNPEDYRPISLTCIVSKIAERFVYTQIEKGIESGLPTQQFGFRSGRSTTDALVRAEAMTLKAMENCKGTSTRVAIVSFDIQKAFDSVSHGKLMEHLQQKFNISLNSRRWLQAFLSDRCFCVKVGSSFSDWSHITCGVPQGTVLGPVLYNAATAGLQDIKLSDGAESTLYADDLLLIKRISTVEEEQQLQDDCNILNSYYNQETLQLNGQKTRLLIASVSPQHQRPLLCPLTVNGCQVDKVSSLKYLGVTFDERLTFEEHGTIVSSKARKMLAAISTTLRKWKMSSQIKKIYESCIRPVMTYGIAVTYPRTAAGRRRLERVNKIAAQMVLRKQDCSYEELLRKLNWESINWMMVKDLLRIMHGYVLLDRQHGDSEVCMKLIEKETGRRTGRTSNFHSYRTSDPHHRLSRTAESAIHRMVVLWNSLPNEIVNIDNWRIFLEKISQTETKTALITVIK
jgi:exonuclease III